jgi:hypothetical protein
VTVEARPTAVIAETTSWAEFPAVWPRLLDEVWSAVRPRLGPHWEIYGGLTPALPPH